MQDFLKDFRQTIATASEQLRLISADESKTPRQPGKWTPREIIGHLIDSAANNHQRFVCAQFTDDLIFPGYEQEQWVAAQAYRDEDWLQLIQLWQLYNQHLVHLISRVPTEVLSKPRHKHNLHEIASQPVAVDEPATLEYFMRDYLGHLKHHLRQIFGE